MPDSLPASLGRWRTSVRAVITVKQRVNIPVLKQVLLGSNVMLPGTGVTQLTTAAIFLVYH